MSAEMALPSGTVTVLLTDVEMSTRNWQADRASALAAHELHDVLVAEHVERHSGVLVLDQGEGDSAFAVFGRASDGLACALSLQAALQSKEWPGGLSFKVRMGLHTGEVILRSGNYHGSEISRCARIRSLAWGGQVLVSSATAALMASRMPPGASLRPLGRHVLKDFDDEELFQLCGPGLDDAFPPLRSLSIRHNLPAQLTTFIGREEEMVQARNLVSNARMVTMTGSGGCGKSRLAAEVASQLVPDFPDGVWFVELSPLREADLVPNAVGDALGMREEGEANLVASIKQYLRDRTTLIVLDNCEHLVDAAGSLAADLLAGAPGLSILATSREPLGLVGEVTWVVPSLGVPTVDLSSLEEIAASDAVELFVDRARLVHPSFQLDETNAAAVAQICSRLDGIPLALELAAARVRVFTPQQIADRLDDRFRLLWGGPRSSLPRQQTLRALVDWSYDLLSDTEKALFARLSVFPGSFSIEAAQSVCGQADISDEVLTTLGQLVDRSLVVSDDTSGQRRFTFLETIREYAREKLELTGEASAVRDHHMRWCSDLVSSCMAEPRTADKLDLLEAEHDNLREALSWSNGGGELRIGLEMVGRLWRFWYIRGHLSEGRVWAETLLQNPTDPGSPERADAMQTAGILSYRQGDYESARRFHEGSLDLRRSIDDKAGVATSLNNLGLIAFELKDYDAAEAMFRECLELRNDLGDLLGTASPLNNLALVADARGDFESARQAYRDSLALRRRFSDVWGIGIVLDNLGQLEQKQGNFERAAGLHFEALTLWQEMGDEVSVADCLERLAGVAVWIGERERAAVLFGAAEAIREENGSPVGSRDREQYDRDVASIRAELDPSAFDQAWHKGREMGLHEAIGLAAELETSSGSATA